MQLSPLSLFTTVISLVQVQALELMINTTSDVYLENKQSNRTIGYSFALFQNVLTVKLNGTSSDSAIEPLNVAIQPNLFLEYNGTVAATNTNSIFGFLDKANDNTDWGKGLLVDKIQGDNDVDVYRISGNWTYENAPQFNTHMYVASDYTKVNNASMDPFSIYMVDSILNYQFKLSNSSLAFDQIFLGSGNFSLTSNSTDKNVTVFGDGGLNVDDKALVDGSEESITFGSLNEQNLDIVVGNSTSIDTSSFNYTDILLTFNNSNGAKNVTFNQRLALNLTLLKNTNDFVVNGANSMDSSKFITVTAFVSCMLLAVPALFF